MKQKWEQNRTYHHRKKKIDDELWRNVKKGCLVGDNKETTKQQAIGIMNELKNFGALIFHEKNQNVQFFSLTKIKLQHRDAWTDKN